jgi:ubiquitin carboxyl-terminal hydrolase L3
MTKLLVRRNPSLLHKNPKMSQLFFVGPGLFNDIIEQAKNLSTDERVELLENSTELASVHDVAASDGQTAAPNREESIDLHFICFIEVDQHLYELDGRKLFPINHGKSTNLVEVSFLLVVSYIRITTNFLLYV